MADQDQTSRLSRSDLRRRAAQRSASNDAAQPRTRQAATSAGTRDGDRSARRRVATAQGQTRRSAADGTRRGARTNAASSSAEDTRVTRAQAPASAPPSTERTRRPQNARTDSAANRDDLRRRGRSLSKARKAGVRATMAAAALGCLIGMLFFLRPTHSNLEKRDLTPFPELTVARLLDGAFFSDLSLWYGDTYPLREPLVRTSQALSGLYGIEPKTQQVGRTTGGDELPPTDGTAQNGEGDASATNKAVEAASDDEVVEVPTERYMAEEIQNKIMEGLYVNDGAAYNIYYFDQESVEQYARAMNTCAKNLEGQATVYSIIVPTSAGALLDLKTLEDLGGTDQEQAIKYFYSLYDRSVHGINVYDTLRAHNDEYIYFRTDHHWTQLGAYYAYLELCHERREQPSNILGREKMTFDNFLGTFYAELGNSDMEANPDYVDAYIPDSTNDMVIWDTEGNEIETNIVTDVSDWNIYSKYNCFISGDRPLSRIDNPNKTDGSSCLVIKDSFGCCFVPLLVDDYQTTWVIDFRYSDRSIPDFVRENDIQDVIFLNAIVLAGTDPVSSALLAQSQNGAA
ncbi:MAG: DHHW family protein [Coriobacteriales bacterium]|nr:DHHW family protein [Coriobacteriales bacterium]